ncbi:MAG: M23 family metallopeptidase, partial [Eubacterium sp.]|nr:M23 family metallopeptidase [Eubacterium sp.]
MSSNSNAKKGNKNLRALFSVICVSIIALGLIVYFSTSSANDPVNEPTTLEDTTAPVQKSVTVEDTTAEETEPETEKVTTPESTSMALLDTNTPYKSFYKYPLTEAVLGGYTEELVYNQTMGDYRSHTAVDFKGDAGTSVFAINDGIVLDVYKDSMLGMVVEIDHGGKLVAKYGGLDVVNVSKG